MKNTYTAAIDRRKDPRPSTGDDRGVSSTLAPRSPSQTRPTHEVRKQATFRLWLLNFAFATVLGVNYLWHVPDLSGAKGWFFALLALTSTAFTLTGVPGLVFWFLVRWVPNARTLGWIQGAFWTVFQVLLYADTRIYNMFRYHFNGQVLNLVAVRGSEDAIHLGWQVWTAITLGLGAVIFLQLWYWQRSLFRSADVVRGRGRPALARPWVLGLLLVPAVFVEKTIYASADLTRDRQITHLARLFPLYARLPADEVASSVLGVESDKPPRIELDGFALDYPHALPAVAPDGPRPNVLVIVIDCWRADRLSATHSPNLFAFAEGSRVFTDHVSSGNSTRYGIFSMIYGLHGSYWFPILGQRRSPVLIDTLDRQGYEFGIFGSASMSYPEMNSTVWAGIQDSVYDDFEAPEPWQRDELAAEAMIEWLDGAGNDSPFFGFLLLDSPHQTYSHPPGETPFTPSALEIDYLYLTRNKGPEPHMLESVRNRYDNAVHHADAVAGRVLDALASHPDADDTIVVLTADHGEEFLECGFFGHTSAFTPQQVRVPFVMRGPGIPPGTEERPTSHLDFAPTVLELMGANPSGRDSWCLGANLLHPPAGRRRVMGGWDELGVWTPSGILRVPLSAFEFDIEVYDYAWRLLHDDRKVLEAETETLERLGAECNRFLR